MLEISIPGSPTLRLAHLVLDYNGTIAEDGEPIAGIAQRLEKLRNALKIHVVTADTHGTVQDKLAGAPVTITVVGPDRQDLAKEAYIEELGFDNVVAVGNGKNDGLMLQKAALGIGVIQKEGAAAEVIKGADLFCTSILDSLDLLLHLDRLRATLRR
ncbi:HAD family hydrolase [Desulfopila sp. IMCC35008]|uniref:HAD family hydrolase n=1 Tax=Desulfopila sp. IMCC35008 TaxID=2653858 RepID=UPI0013D0F59E|nr:ATPase P [Desulfopila sp. IMCC35008]